MNVHTTSSQAQSPAISAKRAAKPAKPSRMSIIAECMAIYMSLPPDKRREATEFLISEFGQTGPSA